MGAHDQIKSVIRKIGVEDGWILEELWHDGIVGSGAVDNIQDVSSSAVAESVPIFSVGNSVHGPSSHHIHDRRRWNSDEDTICSTTRVAGSNHVGRSGRVRDLVTPTDSFTEYVTDAARRTYRLQLQLVVGCTCAYLGCWKWCASEYLGYRSVVGHRGWVCGDVPGAKFVVSASAGD